MLNEVECQRKKNGKTIELIEKIKRPEERRKNEWRGK